MNSITSALEKYCLRDVSLASHSSYEIGGIACYFADPASVEELTRLFESCFKAGAPFGISGLGANILFPDRPNREKVFISLKNYTEINFSENRLFLSSGVPLSFLSIIGLILGDNNLDFTYLLPGCLGSGVFMNVRYFENEICGIIDSVYYIDLNKRDFQITKIKSGDCGFSYKKSIFQGKNWLITGADIVIKSIDKKKEKTIRQIFSDFKGKKQNLSSLSNFYNYFSSEAKSLQVKLKTEQKSFEDIELDRRLKKHFEYPSCGSVFKNNHDFGIPMGKIIEDLGLKGKSHGGASVSNHHGNIIINSNHASSDDVLYLIDFIKDAVYKAHNFVPETEVVIVKE